MVVIDKDVWPVMPLTWVRGSLVGSSLQLEDFAALVLEASDNPPRLPRTHDTASP